MGLTLLTAPAVEPLTLDQVKQHVNDEDTDKYNVLIDRLIGAARRQAEHRTGRALINQQWRLTLDRFAGEDARCPPVIRLPRPALVSVEEVSYLDTDGVRQVLATSGYQVVTDELVGQVRPAYDTTWPDHRVTPGSVRIDYTAGYGATAATVPDDITAWMLLAIGAWYAQREALMSGAAPAELPRAFWEALLDPYLVPYVT